MKDFFSNMGKKFSSKKFKFGTYAVVLTIIGIAVIVLLNIGLTVMEDNFDLRADLTQNKMFSLDAKTTKELQGLQKDIYIYPIYSQGSEDQDLMELLRKYKSLSSHIHVEVVDSVKNPTFVKPFQKNNETISAGSVIVSDADKKFYRILDANGDIYYAQYDENYQVTGYQFKAEESLTRAINYVSTGYQPTVYVVEGHGEMGMSSIVYASEFFDQSNYTVESVNLMMNPEKAVEGNLLVFLAPTSDLSNDEYELLRPLMEKGGRFYFMFDPVKLAGKQLTNFEKLFKLYDISLKSGLVCEGNVQYRTRQTPLIFAPIAGSHEIISSSSQYGSSPIIKNTGAISLPDVAPESSMTITPLLTSSDESYLKKSTDAGTDKASDDEAGPFVLSAAVEKTVGGNKADSVKFIISYSPDSLTDQSLAPYTSNIYQFMYGTMWMKNTDKEITIGSKPATQPLLGFKNEGEKIVVIILACAVAPILLLAAGIFVYIRRKHL